MSARSRKTAFVDGNAPQLVSSGDVTSRSAPPGSPELTTPVPLTSTCPVVLVARTHASGLRAAQLALRQWAGGGVDSSVQLLGLALLADAPGRLPRALKDLAAHVAGGAPRNWHLGWVEAWRTGERLPVAELPKAIGKFVHDLTALTGPPGPR